MPKRYRLFQSRARGKYPKRQVTTTTDPITSEAFYAATDVDAPLDPRLYAAGVIRHPTTGFYQVWLSTNGLDIISISAHRDASRAEADKQEVKELIHSGDIYEEEKVTTLLQKLKGGSGEEPVALPDDLVRKITREILRAVVDRRPQS
jgi:hypothetical protein